MKTFVLVVVLLFSNIASSQNNHIDSLQSDTLELFYILDSRWSPPNTDAQETDDRPNYFQASEGIGVIIGNGVMINGVRLKSFHFYGEVRDLTHSIDKQKNKITSFYLFGKQKSIGKIASFEIIEKPNGEIVLKYYSKYTSEDNFFNIHIATSQEITDIKNYWKAH